MNVAIIGSRSIRKVDIDRHIPEGVTAIITGGAAGVDTLAMGYAKAMGLKLVVFYPDYRTHGRGAPLRRNQAIVEAADLLIAFWDGRSRGTMDTVRKAQKAGKPCQVVRLN